VIIFSYFPILFTLFSPPVPKTASQIICLELNPCFRLYFRVKTKIISLAWKLLPRETILWGGIPHLDFSEAV
jgi:hypothetical protein